MIWIKWRCWLPLLPLRGSLVLLLLQMWGKSVVIATLHYQSTCIGQCIPNRSWSKLVSLRLWLFNRINWWCLSLWHLELLNRWLDNLLLLLWRHLDWGIWESQGLMVLTSLARTLFKSACISESIESMVCA